MKELFDNMLKHPVRTAIIVGGFTSSIVSILHAVRDLKSNSK